MAIISPDTFDPLLRYIGVRLQQGVPIVDADVNELDDIRSFELRAFLKWFVGDGVPEGSDAFHIVATGVADDFTIARGTAPAPPGADNVATGLGFVGRCVIDGRDAIIRSDVAFRSQPLHVSQAGAAALAADWGVPTVAELPAVDTTIVVFIDLWDRLVTPTEEPTLIFPGLGTESAARLRREWVVRWTTDPAPPTFGDPGYLAGHSYYALATVARHSADPLVRTSDVVDQRERRLLLPPATLIEDLFGTSPARYRQGLDRPPISVRSAVNSLLRGELPSTADQQIAPHLGDDHMSFAFGFVESDIVGFWHSNRVGATNQVFAVRWAQNDPASAAAVAPNQITTGVTHRLPHPVQLPGGDLLVVYETNTRDIHFRRAQGIGALAAAPETAVATDATAFERHPYVVRAGNQLVFMWHTNTPSNQWVYRRRQYGANWAEAGATWLDAGGVPLSTITAAPPSATAGDVHALVAGGRMYFAFHTDVHDIAVVRLDPATPAIEDWGPPALTLSSPVDDQQPYLVADGATSIWAFWRGGDQGIFHRRFDVAGNAWPGTTAAVPGTDAPGNVDSRVAAVRDDLGAIWLFWVSSRTGTNDVWVVRRNPDTGGWGEPRQVVTSIGNDDLPYAVPGPGGVIWLFWRSDRSGQFDLYFKRLVTAI